MVDPKDLIQLRRGLPNAGLTRGAIGKVIGSGRAEGILHVEFYDDHGAAICDAFLDSAQLEPLSKPLPAWAQKANICGRCQRIYHLNSACV